MKVEIVKAIGPPVVVDLGDPESHVGLRFTIGGATFEVDEHAGALVVETEGQMLILPGGGCAVALWAVPRDWWKP